MGRKKETPPEEAGERLSPRKNQALVGHDEAEARLLESFNSGRMHHAWLINGPRGIGKATLAYRFARYVLASADGVNNATIEAAPDPAAGLFGDGPETGVSDVQAIPGSTSPLFVGENTPVFRRVAAGGHSDLFAIERRRDEKTGRLKSVITVDDVRGIGHFLSMTAAEGGWRVVIVDSADEMNVNAANAILKVLEEPPARTVIMLVSHNPADLMPTIRSRCTRLNLRPLDLSMVAELVRYYEPEISTPDSEGLAGLGEGSLGKALALFDAGGLQMWKELSVMLERLPAMDVSQIHALADRVSRPGQEEQYTTVTSLVRLWLERFIISRSGGDNAGLDRWFKVWEKINLLISRADAVNLDKKQVVLDIFLGLEGAARAHAPGQNR